MDFPRITVFVGRYGSGKTEISLNTVIFHAKRGRKTILADVDIVNPYFRSSEKAQFLIEMGIKVLKPSFADLGVDIPSLPAETLSAFSDRSAYAVFDAGGDPVGAMALGRYKEYFEREGYAMYCVVNPRRPLSSTPEEIAEMLSQIEGNSRLKATGLINNANLACETSAKDLADCAGVVREAAKLCGVPVAYTCGTKGNLERFREYMSAEDGEPYPIEIYMRPEWM
ncbi:MAG: hypothetical protein Q8O09_04595 [Bacillota bacterium]|nr:hypothetical protein [Bacillota bacterium]